MITIKCPNCGERISPEVDKYSVYDPPLKKWFCNRTCLGKYNERRDRNRRKLEETNKQQTLRFGF